MQNHIWVLWKLQSNDFPLKLLIGCNFYQVSSTSIYSWWNFKIHQLQDKTSLENLSKMLKGDIYCTIDNLNPKFNFATSISLFMIPTFSVSTRSQECFYIFFLAFVTKRQRLILAEKLPKNKNNRIKMERNQHQCHKLCDSKFQRKQQHSKELLWFRTHNMKSNIERE